MLINMYRTIVRVAPRYVVNHPSYRFRQRVGTLRRRWKIMRKLSYAGQQSPGYRQSRIQLYTRAPKGKYTYFIRVSLRFRFSGKKAFQTIVI